MSGTQETPYAHATLSRQTSLTSSPWLPVLGPQRAAPRPHPLGKDIRLRIHLDGCKGLPQPKTSSESSAPRKFKVTIQYTSSTDVRGDLTSSFASEGRGHRQGTLQWDDTLYLTCFEHSFVRILLCDGYYRICERVCPAVDLLQVSSVPANSEESHVLENDSSVTSQSEDAFSRSQLAARSWDVAFRGISSFAGVVSQANIASTAEYIYRTQLWTYTAYQACNVAGQIDDTRIDSLLNTLAMAANECVQVQSTHILHRKSCVEQITTQLHWLAKLVYKLTDDSNSAPNAYREEGLARLVVILVTPDPPTGVSSTSTGGDWTALYGTIAKDALLFTLEGIVQSSDAFPPLKSAASGLLFFATSADMASNNKKHIRDIHKRVNNLAASLRCGAEDGSMLSSAHHNAIGVLAADISALKEDLEAIVHERKSRFRRFFSARRHREELQDIVQQMDHARLNYTSPR
ncbi:unnamed protein product [Peniophora sp. CBMAI 1063]|nr:unnamed protein product [Peniophora sp. CBMAI 1063]